jgi:hypothetical protein
MPFPQCRDVDEQGQRNRNPDDRHCKCIARLVGRFNLLGHQISWVVSVEGFGGGVLSVSIQSRSACRDDDDATTTGLSNFTRSQLRRAH